ncbi:MAG: energy-coupling factor transporter ATPase [Lachnospiraceae bacterium]|nr:energy-coupling factor transporter ATPase [Lachnospiraceae bacterium]
MTLEFDHVNCIYDAETNQPVKALSDVSLTIGGGEFIGLIGHTGSGKSTLMQHANGLLKPTGGRILADGTDIWSRDYDRRSLRARVGLVFQYPEHQLFETDVLTDVCFGPKNLGKSAKDAEALAKEALEQVGIDKSQFALSPFELSGGQKRRVAIAGVLSMQPEILILDEPTAGLDPRGRKEILSLVKRLHREKGITVVLVSHSMEDVARFADRILVMDHGALLLNESPASIFSRRETLQQIGLNIPETLLLLDELRRAGLGTDDPAMPLTPEDTAEVILSWLQ